MLIFKKFVIVGDTFYNSRPLSNHECGTDDDQLWLRMAGFCGTGVKYLFYL